MLRITPRARSGAFVYRLSAAHHLVSGTTLIFAVQDPPREWSKEYQFKAAQELLFKKTGIEYVRRLRSKAAAAASSAGEPSASSLPDEHSASSVASEETMARSSMLSKSLAAKSVEGLDPSLARQPISGMMQAKASPNVPPDRE